MNVDINYNEILEHFRFLTLSQIMYFQLSQVSINISQSMSNYKYSLELCFHAYK